MMVLSIVSLLVGAALGQRFKIFVLMPATVMVLVLAAGTGVVHADSVWSVVLMTAAAAGSMQIGYLIGIGVHHVLGAAVSNRPSPLASPAASTSARHHAR